MWHPHYWRFHVWVQVNSTTRRWCQCRGRICRWCSRKARLSCVMKLPPASTDRSQCPTSRLPNGTRFPIRVRMQASPQGARQPTQTRRCRRRAAIRRRWVGRGFGRSRSCGSRTRGDVGHGVSGRASFPAWSVCCSATLRALWCTIGRTSGPATSRAGSASRAASSGPRAACRPAWAANPPPANGRRFSGTSVQSRPSRAAHSRPAAGSRGTSRCACYFLLESEWKMAFEKCVHQEVCTNYTVCQ